MRALQDEGSICAVAGHRHAGHVAYLGLMAMQHRARAGVGIAAVDQGSIRGLARSGPIEQVFTGRMVDDLDGRVAVGRLTGAPALDGAGHGFTSTHEPVVRTWSGGRITVAVAGRITNAKAKREEIFRAGGALAGESDGELVAEMIAREPGRTLVNRVVSVLHDLTGAFSLVIASHDRLIAARDPHGFRPLSVGVLGSATVVSTEDSALRDLGCSQISAISPGEVLVVDGSGLQRLQPFLPRPRSASLVDLVEIGRPDSSADGVAAYELRLALGAAVGKERPAPGAGTIVGLPGFEEYAVGYAKALGRQFVPALRGAPFADHALPSPADVDDAVFRSRFRASGVSRADVALVVPALVSGSRVERAARALRIGGARRVHLRVATPVICFADPYGVAMPPPEALAGIRLHTPEQMADGLEVDSAAALSLVAMRSALPAWEDGWCDTMFSGEHPVLSEVGSDQLGLFETSD